MSKQAPFISPQLRLSSQMDNGAFVKIITWTFFKKKYEGPELHKLEFQMKLKLPFSITRKF